jgi:hypothetical protein
MLYVILLATLVTPVNAQGTSNTGEITLASLGETGILLKGPYDASSVTFGLPAEWKLAQGAQIILNTTTSFNVNPEGNAGAINGGTLTVSMNRNTLAILPLNSIGNLEFTLDVRSDYLVSQRNDGRMELRFELNSGISCTANQHMNVIINPGTKISLPYEEVRPSTDLINFPRPIYQASINPDFALIVVSDGPTAAELQSAITVASGFGNLTAGKLGLDLITSSQLTPDLQANNHIIFVGNAASIQQLEILPLALPVVSGKFSLTGDSSDDGVIQMIDSPWSVRKVVMVVSGNTDAGTLKAARAVSTGILRSNTSPNLSIVENVQETLAASPLISEQTFADMGYDRRQLSNRGIDSAIYNFYIPPGNTVAAEAYLDLSFGHSALLNYDLSGIVVLLNDQPVGSIRFTDITASQAINRVQINIPSFAVLPGNNRLEVRSNLEPIDTCSNPNLRGLWVTIWPDSRLHLPFSPVQLSALSALDLTFYPAPMVLDPTLSGTALILQKDNFQAWQAALDIATFMGDQSNGPISTLSVFFDDQVAGVNLDQYDLIVIGEPSQLDLMEQLNAHLPVQFEKGTNDISNSSSLQVTYRIPPDVPIGYIELFPSPWNKDKVVITALGNTPQGIAWAASALGYQPSRGQLSGNFAIINDTQVQSIDTRIDTFVEDGAIDAGLPTAEPTPANTDLTAPASARQIWILPALVVAILLIIIFGALFLYRSLRQSR